MIKAYYTATNGAISNKNYLDVISNNMANIQTEGFKKSIFDSLLNGIVSGSIEHSDLLNIPFSGL